MKGIVLRFVTFICLAVFVAVPGLSHGQDDSGPLIKGLEVLLGGAAPENSDAGALIGLFLSPLEELSGTELFQPLRTGPPEPGTSGTLWSLQVTPEIDVAVGGEENANHIIAKIQGHFLAIGYKPHPEDGKPTLDSDGFFNVFPIAAGVETDQSFRNLNALFEIGWTPFNTKPWFTYGKRAYKLGVNPRFGMFLQSGYKFEIDNDLDDAPTGNAQDESEEEPDSAILRLKADLRSTLDLYKSQAGGGLLIQPSATVWYDIANGDVYYKFRVGVEAKISAQLAWVTAYEHGSGAPNFNQGDQFSTGLKMTF